MIAVQGGPGVTATVGPNAAAGGVPFWALMGFTFVVLIAPQEYLPVLASLRIALLMASVAVMTYLFDRFVHRQPMTVLTREIWAAMGLVGWAVLTLPLSYWPGASVAFLVGFYFKSLAIFWLLGNTVNTLPRLGHVAWGLSLMAAPLAATAVGNFISGYFISGVAHPAAQRIVGYDAPLTGNPNDLALMLNLIIPLSVALLLTAQRPALRILLVALIFLDVLAVIATFSRGGFVTLAMIVGVYVWKFRGRPERAGAWVALLLVLACLPLLPSGYLERLATITDVDSDITGSAQLRWNDTLAAVGLVLASPIVGSGIGMNVRALSAVRGPDWTAVHNVYLEYAVELGLPGLVLFLVLLVGSINSASLVQKRSAGIPALSRLFYLAEGVQVSLIAFAVAALFHPVGYHLYFYYLAGLAVAVKGVYAAEQRRAGPSTPPSLREDSRSRGHVPFRR